MGKILLTRKNDLYAGLDKAQEKYKVAALTKKQDKILYGYITSSKDIVFEYTPTVLSPKKFFFPQEETILEYTSEGKVFPKVDVEPTVLFGIRPCDLNAMKILNEAFAESNGDPNFLAKKNASIIIGIDCKNVCDETAFCYKVGSQNAESGYDILLKDLGDKYIVEIASEKGQEFVDEFIDTEEYDDSEKKTLGTLISSLFKSIVGKSKPGTTLYSNYENEKIAGFKGKELFEKLNELPEIFESNKNHKYWDDEAKKCLSCGSCIMVCPTCYCFDVADELALSLKKGERIRRWDACMVRSFAEVAGGENFREEVKNRLKHRLSRKFNYLMKKHSQPVCVGCGRCVRACLPDISPKEAVEELSKS